MKCIVTNKYASRVLEYNNTNSQKICTWHFNSNDFIKTMRRSVEFPRRTETSHFFIKSLELMCQVHIFDYLYIYIHKALIEAAKGNFKNTLIQ